MYLAWSVATNAWEYHTVSRVFDLQIVPNYWRRARLPLSAAENTEHVYRIYRRIRAIFLRAVPREPSIRSKARRGIGATD